MRMGRQLLVLWVTGALAGCSVKPVTFTPEDVPGDGPPDCHDGTQNGDETAVDCGGACGPCADGRSCAAPIDCSSGVCTAGQCEAASCVDKVKNGDETAADCGGSCRACGDGSACNKPDDCNSRVCTNSLCMAASCMDDVKNGDETDVNCGGACGPCADGRACGDQGDCTSKVCAANQCAAPTCTDFAANGAETDVDCGGSQCPACAFGNACAFDRDCAGAGVCDALHCRPARSCAEIHQLRPTLGDGAYTIVPVGVAQPFDVRCDMTRDGGGWTLLLKADGASSLTYAAPAWTDATLINPTDLTTLSGNAKYASFVAMPVTTLVGELDGFRYAKAFASQTAQQIFAGVADYVTDFPTFNTGAPNWSAQPNCHVFGVNLPFSTPSRFGWSANQENDCLTNDTGIGLGLSGRGAGYRCGSTLCSAGNVDAGGDGLLWGR